MGKGAPTEFIEQLENMVNTHHEKVEVDVIRAYHFGARFIVEVWQIPHFQNICHL